MAETTLDSIDQQLLNRLQAEFPLVSRPYADIASHLNASEDEVIRRISALRSGGIIRQIGPLLDAKKINYRTTLVAAAVPQAGIDRASDVLAGFPVSHAYERNHRFNLWFTLALPASADADEELKKIASPLCAEACVSLPALKVFKLRVYFRQGDDDQAEAIDNPRGITVEAETELSNEDRLVVNAIQEDVSLESRPFAAMAAGAGMNEETFLERYRSLLSRGIVRRVSVAVNHRKVGFVANGMACWTVPPDRVDEAGDRLASLPAVSHCYERKTGDLWKHNVFAMIHGHAKEECQATADRISEELGLTGGILLYSMREFKKTRLKYPV